MGKFNARHFSRNKDVPILCTLMGNSLYTSPKQINVNNNTLGIRMLLRLVWLVVVLILLAIGVIYFMGSGILGQHRGVNPVNESPVPPQLVGLRTLSQKRTARALGVEQPKQVLFGDLHVHSTFSTDAFMLSMPAAGGEGAHPVSDACDFARYCSALDFWSINDHALAITPQRWQETKQAIRQCNAVASSARNPDTVAYLGWEWTNVGATVEEHWGHKNVVLRDLDEQKIPARPITTSFLAGTEAPSNFALGLLPFLLGFNQDTWDQILYMQEISPAIVPACEPGVPVRELPIDCLETAPSPKELFAKLNDWGHASMVIPHGTSWGFYTPAGSSWDKQLSSDYHDPDRQFLAEVYSGHGNSEEFRSFASLDYDSNGKLRCPPVQADFTPACQRAGQIISERCQAAGLDEQICAERIDEAQQLYLQAGQSGFLTVPGAKPNDWLDAGQCQDCFQPAFNLRPKSSVQYMLALGKSAEQAGAADKSQQRFRFGIMAASDNHSSRPGTGYKEYARTEMTEARLGGFTDSILGGRLEQQPEPQSKPFVPEDNPEIQFFGQVETERQGSFFYTGGLSAVHSTGRSREQIWDALQRKEVYGTSGPRILLWFDLEDGAQRLPMGSETNSKKAPQFQVRALGSLEQNPGCPDYSRSALTPERLHYLCRNECYNPSDKRRAISRIEVVRIHPQRDSRDVIGTAQIQDPWRVFNCDNTVHGCEVSFTDEEFTENGRDTVYYVRAIEAATQAVNAANLRCEYDAAGRCITANLCNSSDPAEDCLAETEHRAWSSPIFVDYAG
ncbi:MAG: DUF3604 domain-containing protein [Pseudomonadales bacterium]